MLWDLGSSHTNLTAIIEAVKGVWDSKYDAITHVKLSRIENELLRANLDNLSFIQFDARSYCLAFFDLVIQVYQILWPVIITFYTLLMILHHQCKWASCRIHARFQSLELCFIISSVIIVKHILISRLRFYLNNGKLIIRHLKLI